MIEPIAKPAPSIVRFVLVNAAHTVTKYSKRLRLKYPRTLRRPGRNLTVARILIELIYPMLKNYGNFVGQIDTLTEIKANSSPASKVGEVMSFIKKKGTIDLINEPFFNIGRYI